MSTVEIWSGNLVHAPCEAIVNAANSGLSPGTGVCGDVFEAAGFSKLRDACRELGGCPVGQAKTTPSFDLEKRGIEYVIHAVGPRWYEHTPEEADALLASAYEAALVEAERLKVSSIAFPMISTGVFKFPKDRASGIAVRTCSGFQGNLERVLLVAFTPENEKILRSALGL